MPSSLKTNYTTFMNSAVAWLNRHGYYITRSPQIIIEVHQETAVIRLSEALHFREWPYRFGSKKRIDILATVQETVSLEQRLCTRATTRVNYFRMDGRRAIATEMLHYDFVAPPEMKHPVCHAQSTNALLDASERPDWFRRNRTVDDSGIGERGQNVRIPSAFVNLPGLIMILASDHMAPDDWEEFSDLFRPQFEGFPCMTGSADMKNMIGSSGLCVWAWYESKASAVQPKS